MTACCWRVSALLKANSLVDDEWFTPASRNRGRIVHAIAEAVVTGAAVDVAPAYDGYLSALRNAFAALCVQVVCVERRLEDPMAYVSGRPDVIGWLPRQIGAILAGPCIVDVKSGKRLPVHGVQLAFYERLAVSDNNISSAIPDGFRDLPWQRIGLYVTPTGRYHIVPYDDPQDFLACDAIVNLTVWRVAHGLLRPDDLTGQYDDDPALPESGPAAAVVG